MTEQENARLQASKITGVIDFIERSYRLGLWTTFGGKPVLEHDLGVMLAYEDLRQICLQFLAADKTVLSELEITINGESDGRKLRDSANGVELPLLDRRAVADCRITVQRNGNEDQYRHLLKGSWSRVESLRRRPSGSYVSEHAARITGGRQTGIFRVADESRHRLVVTQTGTRGYAFAEDLDLGAQRVFIHSRFAPAELRLHPGMHVTALVIQTPRGLQARNVQRA